MHSWLLTKLLIIFYTERLDSPEKRNYNYKAVNIVRKLSN